MRDSRRFPFAIARLPLAGFLLGTLLMGSPALLAAPGDPDDLLQRLQSQDNATRRTAWETAGRAARPEAVRPVGKE